VRAERDQVGIECGQVEVHVRCRLDRVDMEHQTLARPHPGGDLGHRLDGPDLVVSEHDRDQDRLVVERRLELVRIHPPVAIDRQLDDLEPELLEVPQRMTDGVVLDRRGDDPVAARLARPGRALQGEVVGLRAARGEDDLAPLGAQPCRDALVGIIERRARRATERMGRARVPERLGHERQHRVEDLAPERRRRGVIEVDRHRPDRTPEPCSKPCPTHRDRSAVRPSTDVARRRPLR